MTERQEIEVLAAVLSALQEVDPTGTRRIPASSIYLALGMDMTAHQRVTGALRAAGYARCTATTIQLTTDGLEAGARLNAALATKAVQR